MKAFTIKGVDAANKNNKSRGRKDDDGGEKKKKKRDRRANIFSRVNFLAVIDPTGLNEQLRQIQEKILKQFVDEETGKFKLPDFKAALEELREERQHMEYHPDRKRLSSVADFFQIHGRGRTQILRRRNRRDANWKSDLGRFEVCHAEKETTQLVRQEVLRPSETELLREVVVVGRFQSGHERTRIENVKSV